MDARETFEHAARAARRLPSVIAELGALDEAWRFSGEWLGGGSSHAGHSDPTAARAGYCMRRAKRLEAERDELQESVDEARALARGIGELLGESHAAALTHRYIENQPWAEVAKALGVCERTAYARASTALDTVDALGPHRVKQAQGMATA